MKKEVNKTLIGAFILGALALGVAGALVLGGSNLFKKSNRYVIYFSGSVKGLALGAPVQLKGVTLGKVTSINLVYDVSEKTFLNRVAFEISKESIKIAGSRPASQAGDHRPTMEETVDDLVAIGLRAKLKIQSIVTGQLLVAFDFYPETPVRRVSIEDDLHELPTLPSDMEALEQTLETLDIKGLVESIKGAAGGIDALINSPALQTLAANANHTLADYRQLATSLESGTTATLADARRLIKGVEGQIPSMARSINGTAADLRKTIAHMDQGLQPAMATIEEAAAAARDAFKQAETMLSNLTYLSSDDSVLIYQIGETLSESRKAAHALALLVEYLNRHPEALLQGKKAAGGTP